MQIERTCFAEGRATLVRQLNTLGKAIEDGASEVTMIAAENVFAEQVSKVLAAEARAMYRIARGLKDLGLELARARTPRSRK